MQITIIAVGSRGDVQPYVALGSGLQAEGHQVRVATHAEFAPLVQDHSLAFHHVEGNPRAVLESSAGQDWQKSSGNPLLFFRHLRRVAAPIIRPLTTDCWQACRDADLVLYSNLAFIPVYAIRPKLRAPIVAAFLQPATPTREFATPRFPPAPAWLPRGQGVYNRLTHVLMSQLFWYVLRDTINATRQDVLHLPPLPLRSPYADVQRRRVLHLYGYSAHVVPPPSDWGAWNHVTGYWFVPRSPAWQPSPDLQAFLAAGPPPVYVGFGSMKPENPEEMTSVILQALARAGQRGVLSAGWGGLCRASLPDSVYAVDEVPHDWLFPRVAAVVHHGGAGTTAAGLRAGRPTITVPFFGDQFFWARRVSGLGVGPPPIPRKDLSVEELAGAIALAVNNGPIGEHAAALGQQIRAEDGIQQAIAALQKYLQDLDGAAALGH